jgi:hypothetical protein
MEIIFSNLLNLVFVATRSFCHPVGDPLNATDNRSTTRLFILLKS